MQSSVASRSAVLTQRSFMFGSVLAIIGGVMVIASAFFPWQVHVIDECCGLAPVVMPYYGSGIGDIFGVVGSVLAFVPFVQRDHAPIAAGGALFGWWIAGGGRCCLAFLAHISCKLVSLSCSVALASA